MTCKNDDTFIPEVKSLPPQFQKENLLRQAIRELIIEAKKDIEDTPYSSTAINLLEDLLKQIEVAYDIYTHDIDDLIHMEKFIDHHCVLNSFDIR